MSRKYLKLFSAAVISLLVAIILLHNRELTGEQGSNDLSARVVAVNDGDTVSVMIGRKKERVRLIGIDAPELAQRPWGAEAKRYLRELVTLSRNSVTLEFDVERRDQYGRLLAYVWTQDNRMINLEMLRNGYAVLYTMPPNVKHVGQLREGQQYARGKGLGIWGKNGLRETPRDYRNAHPR
jgi:micrococcal nuclease